VRALLVGSVVVLSQRNVGPAYRLGQLNGYRMVIFRCIRQPGKRAEMAVLQGTPGCDSSLPFPGRPQYILIQGAIMESLKDKKCLPCREGSPQADPAKINEYMTRLPGWKIIQAEGENRLQKVFKFKNFRQALDFTDRVGEAAEAEDHHPALLTEWGKVTVTWWTHKIHGLHENDFIMAAKTEEIY
jgi:4a-hydroxytetrahydrobiopterin dehydratase